MIMKEKVYTYNPLILQRERVRGQPIKFSTRTRCELIMVGLVTPFVQPFKNDDLDHGTFVSPGVWTAGCKR